MDIARVAQEYGGRPVPAGLAEPPAPLAPPLSPQPGSLAETVLAWLSGVAGADMQTYAPVVASAIEAQLAPYDIYEAAVRDGLNQHLSRLMHALGLGRPSALTASALSHVCGRTLRDWGAASW